MDAVTGRPPSGAIRPAFRCEGLRKIYRTGETEVAALRGVDLTIGEGETVVLLGPSGSGKSTLLNIIGALDRPTSGRLYFRDVELTGLSDAGLTRFRRRAVGFIFQFYNLIPSLTAEENVRLATDVVETPMDAAEALDRVGLSDRRHHYPAQLSGGEQQRVAVARALAKRPEVLLCDEPTGALDSVTGTRVLQTLAQANRELGATLILITHNAGVAAMADRVFHFLDGRVVRIETNDTPTSPSRIVW